MRDTTFFGLLFALVLGFAIMAGVEQSRIEDECTAKGGILVQTYSNDDVCVKKDAIIK
ncbi:hypothetical protein [Pseudomonas phage COT4]|uniref:Uncharacterized protein n=1 Tax=Pseudomonas phage M5.1 TaxID=2873460 RepID=A0AAE9BP75_9CAUD|nr:hypothetical protein QGX13_gp006 [Pseudomonas phage M5.1]UAV89607.1 hypothetical protein M51_6 [Pseudomonas phage M5.1]UGL61207.1 hypothetical protein [Pseudomonas phage COT4]